MSGFYIHYPCFASYLTTGFGFMKNVSYYVGYQNTFQCSDRILLPFLFCTKTGIYLCVLYKKICCLKR